MRLPPFSAGLKIFNWGEPDFCSLAIGYIRVAGSGKTGKGEIRGLVLIVYFNTKSALSGKG